MPPWEGPKVLEGGASTRAESPRPRKQGLLCYLAQLSNFTGKVCLEVSVLLAFQIWSHGG